MKTLYLDCGMGAAGDILAAALLELLPDGDEFLGEVNALGIPGVHIKREAAVKCGITGTHISVTVNGAEEESLDHGHGHLHGHHDGHSHHHSSLHDIEHIVRDHLPLPQKHTLQKAAACPWHSLPCLIFRGKQKTRRQKPAGLPKVAFLRRIHKKALYTIQRHAAFS